MPDEYFVQFSRRLPRRRALDMVLAFAVHGDGPQRVKNQAELRQFLRHNGFDLERVVEDCRDFSRDIPFFEGNQLGSTWHVVGGGTHSVVDRATDEEYASVTGPGVIATHTYWVLFEGAVETPDFAVQRASFPLLIGAGTQGIASVEAYLGHQAEVWNRKHPTDRHEDSADRKVSLDTKLRDWVPAMAGGRRVDLSGIMWRDFRELRDLRDNLAAHPKPTSSGLSCTSSRGA